MQSRNGTLARVASTVRGMYSPKFILLNVAMALVYYAVFNFMLTVQEHGISLSFVPPYLVYALVITSSIVFTISVYSYFNTRNNNAKTHASLTGTGTAIIGGVIGGCNCTVPLLFSLTAIGVSAVQIVALVNFVSANSALLFGLMIAINLFVMLYYLNKLSEPSCKIRKR